jgi:hypothetical protein
MLHPRDKLICLIEQTLRSVSAVQGPGSALAHQTLGQPIPNPDDLPILPGQRVLDRVLDTFAISRLHPTSPRLASNPTPTTNLPAHLQAWSARSTHDRAVLGQIVQHQQSNGAFAIFNHDESPDLFWFSELVLLHAITSAAIEYDDRALLGSARRAAAFHFAETQPDHATTQPWAIHAFVLDPAHVSLSELILHGMFMNSPEGPGELALLLLADALHCLRKLSP